jgi:DNA integrity scanning protein DisA with diadenylate cyclase activity
VHLRAILAKLVNGKSGWLDHSRVDGGVLITDHYQLLGFGVEVVAPADELRTITLDDGSKENIEQYGTRHRSAFRLCDCYCEAVAFVCSQDGGIKCVRNVNGTVRLWK